MGLQVCKSAGLCTPLELARTSRVPRGGLNPALSPAQPARRAGEQKGEPGAEPLEGKKDGRVANSNFRQPTSGSAPPYLKARVHFPHGCT